MHDRVFNHIIRCFSVKLHGNFLHHTCIDMTTSQQECIITGGTAVQDGTAVDERTPCQKGTAFEERTIIEEGTDAKEQRGVEEGV